MTFNLTWKKMVVARIALPFLIDLIFCSQRWFTVDAVENYAAYFDPNNQGENHNPKGSGYQPLGPYDWNNVVSLSYAKIYFISAILASYLNIEWLPYVVWNTELLWRPL
jgi:hypothetical protein